MHNQMHPKTALSTVIPALVKPLIGVSLACAMLGVVPSSPAYAAGVVGTGSPASCTEIAFDAARVGGGLVTFNCGPNPVTIMLSATKQISEDTHIDGGDRVTLRGSNSGVYIQVFSDRALTLTHIALAGFSHNQGGALQNFGTLYAEQASFVDNQNADQGGVIYNNGVLRTKNAQFINNTAKNEGGAIYNNAGDITLESTSFISNAATNNISNGGAVANGSGVITITASSFGRNRALDGGAVWVQDGTTAIITGSQFISNSAGYGGAVENRGVVTITKSLINQNAATFGDGGGIWNLSGNLYVRDTTISNNTAATTGGGISHYASTMLLDRVTISGNTAADNGGGVYASAPMNLTNVTISGNTATGASAGGGGVFQGPGTASLQQVTFANNNASFGKALYKDGSAGGNLYLQSSIVSVNGGMNTVACDGTITSLGYNVSDGNCSMLTQTGDANMTALNLGPLANNGGGMLTHLPAANSPAINRVALANCLIVDQRGASRPVGPLCDSGAVEAGAAVSVPVAFMPALSK